MSRLPRAALAALCLATAIGLPGPAQAATPVKVAVIVGPVGDLTPTYLAFAEAAATTAERHGATVARAYSPNAYPATVLEAVKDANVIIYFGHGWGHPSPYGGLDTSRQNGWALQGPMARGTHEDGLDGYVQYLGEDWIVANARPAAGFVMIYSNTCYAPGASEGGYAPATPEEAALRVAFYSRAVFALGGSAYYATDFDVGAADLVDRLLGDRSASYGTAFVNDYRYDPWGLTVQAHPLSAGQQIWLHRSKYAEGPPNYWYAFAGNPDLAPLRAWDVAAPTAALVAPAPSATDVPVDAAIQVRFSEPVAGVGAATVTLRDAGGAAVLADVAYDTRSQLATIRPTSPLALSATYAVDIGDGILDEAGRPLANVSWRFTTRFDADPLGADLSITLEAGTHLLTRFAGDGTATETRSLEVLDRRWVLADRRARLPGQVGSWLHLDDAVLGDWWIAESSLAHADGLVEEAVLAPGTAVTLRRADYPVVGTAGLAPEPSDALAPGPEVTVAVDRRQVSDGRTFLRLAETRAAGSWIEVAPATATTEPASQRILATEVRSDPAAIDVNPGEHAAFRFDAAGRVLDRRSVPVAPGSTFSTRTTIVVGGTRFAVVADGDLAGWALAEGDALRVIAPAGVGVADRD